MTRLFAALLALFLAAGTAFAVNPDEVLDDPALEARARNLSAELRCMVCQNQSIDDSNAELAKDLRILVRERLKAGDTDEQVIDYVVSRYGEFVLLKPRFSARTLLLWGMPVMLLVIGATVVVVQLRKRPRAAAVTELTAEEKAKLEAILKQPPASD
jgi:cytochrome c-type biogenesis protein CcmH